MGDLKEWVKSEIADLDQFILTDYGRGGRAALMQVLKKIKDGYLLNGEQKTMTKDFIKDLMAAVIIMDEAKMKLVKEQDFVSANKLRTAIKSIRELIKLESDETGNQKSTQ